MWRKTRSFWGAFEIPDSLDYYLYRTTAPVLRLPVPGFGLLAPLGLLGAVLSWRRRGWPRMLIVFTVAYSGTVILFFVSGCAHLIYFFLPWFIKEQLGPLFRTAALNTGHRSGEAIGSRNDGVANFSQIAVQVGVVLCLAAFAVWSLQSEIAGNDDHNLALITKANCVAIGGAAQDVAGKLVCIVMDKVDQAERSDKQENNS